jgi:hypothetical protein
MLINPLVVALSRYVIENDVVPLWNGGNTCVLDKDELYNLNEAMYNFNQKSKIN